MCIRDSFGIASSILLFFLEMLMDLEITKLAPVLGLIGGSVFLMKGAMLSGRFYLAAAALFLTSIPMTLFPKVSLVLFGLIGGLCYFIPGYAVVRRGPGKGRHPRGPKTPKSPEKAVSPEDQRPRRAQRRQ